MTNPRMNALVCAAAAILIAIAAACGREESPSTETARETRYPEPRFPSYLKPPSSIEDVLPHVRPLVRNKAGFQGSGLGIVQPGETVVLILQITAEPMVVEAVKRAMEERGVHVNLVHEYELVGVSREDAIAYRKAHHSYTSEQGYMEAATWVETTFPEPDAVKEWLRSRRPDLADKLFPKGSELSAHLREVTQKLRYESVGKGLIAYVRSHSEVRGVFWGKGRGTFLRRFMHPEESKFLGIFVFDNRWDVMSALGNYPGDVWQLAEEQTMSRSLRDRDRPVLAWRSALRADRRSFMSTSCR